MDKINPEELEDLLDLLPPKKISVKRVALNVQDNYIKAKCNHLPFKDYLDKKTRLKVAKEEHKYINDSYNKSNSISAKAPWTETPKSLELKETANRSAFSLGLSSYSPDSNINSYSNQDFEEYNNSDHIQSKKNDLLDDFFNNLSTSDSTNEDTNAYSFSKIVNERPPTPVGYWPNSKIRLTTQAWIDRVKRPKINKKSPAWF